MNSKNLIESCKERRHLQILQFLNENKKKNRTKRNENRGVNPLFAEPNETVCQAIADAVNYIRFAQKNKTTNEEEESGSVDLGLKRE